MPRSISRGKIYRDHCQEFSHNFSIEATDVASREAWLREGKGYSKPSFLHDDVASRDCRIANDAHAGSSGSKTVFRAQPITQCLVKGWRGESYLMKLGLERGDYLMD